MRQYEFMKETDENGKDSVNVSYKPKRKLDLFPRIVCLFIALIIWLWMVNFNDTDVTETMVLKINYIGLEALEDRDMMIYGMDKSEITVTVKGSNRDIRKHDADKYSAVVDVTGVDETGSHTLPLTVKIPEDINVTVESDPLNISLMADLRSEKEVEFDVLVTPAPDSGLVKYSYLSYVEPEITYIKVVGPKSVVDQISSARFNVNGNFVSTNDQMQFSDFPLIFLDKNLSEIDTLGTLNYSTDDIFVNVMASAHKTISLNVVVTGEGSHLIAKPNLSSLEIWGAPSVIRSIGDYTVEIERAELGKTAKYDITGDLFPEGINVKENVTIIISFEEPIR